MKLIILLAAIIAASAYPGLNRPVVQNIQLQPGFVYIYKYHGRVLTGIPQLAEQYAGSELSADLVFQPRLNGKIISMKLSNIVLGTINEDVPNSYEEDIQVVHRRSKEAQRQLARPITFVQLNGKIISFTAENTEPEWSLNIKKSILSLFNVNLTPQKIMRSATGNLIPKPINYNDLAYYGVYEKSPAGVCETVYEVGSAPDPKDQVADNAFVLNVTKTRNYENCLTEPTMMNENMDIRGCLAFCQPNKMSAAVVQGYYPVPLEVSDPALNGCPCGQQGAVKSPIDQFNFVKYNISTVGIKPVIESLLSEGKVVYKTNGEKILLVTHQNATLVSTVPTRPQIIPDVVSPVEHFSLEFRLPVQHQQQGTQRKLQQVVDIPLMHIFEAPNYREWAQNLPPLFEKIADQIIAGDVTASKNVMLRVTDVVRQLAVFPLELLETTYRQIAQPGRSVDATQKQQIVRSLFLQALPFAGTNQAAIFIKQLLEANLISQAEAKPLIETLPQNMFLPDVRVLNEYLELTQNPQIKRSKSLLSSSVFAFAKMVQKACVRVDAQPGDIPNGHTVPMNKRGLPAQMIVKPSDPRRQVAQAIFPGIQQQQQQPHQSRRWSALFPQSICSEADIVKYVHVIARLVQEAQTHEEKLVYIESLSMLGVPQVLAVLEPIVTGKITHPGYPVDDVEKIHEEINYIRTAAIISLQNLVPFQPQQIQAILLPIYRSAFEPYQVRLTAFSVILQTKPQVQVLDGIVSALHRETNQQVRSFVVSALEKQANLTIPQFVPFVKNVQQVVDFLPENVKQGMEMSSHKEYDSYDEEKELGLIYKQQVIASNISSIPRFAEITFKTAEGPFMDELLKISYHSKGFEKLVKRLLEPQGILANVFETLSGERKQHDTQTHRPRRSVSTIEQALDILKQKLGFVPRVDEIPKAQFLLKVLGQTSLVSLDEQSIKELVDDFEVTLQQWAEKLVAGYSGHIVKLFWPQSYIKMLPNELGMPVTVTHVNPVILSLKIDNAKFSVSTGSAHGVLPIVANLSALVTPQVLHASIISMETHAPDTKLTYGTLVQKQSQIVLPVEIVAGIVEPKNLVKLSIIPRVPHQILHYKSEARTFVTDMRIASAPERDIIGSGKLIKSAVKPFVVQKNVGQQLFGIGFNVQLETEDEWASPRFLSSIWTKIAKKGLLPTIIQVFKNEGLKNKELKIRLEPDQQLPTTGIDFSFRYTKIASELGFQHQDVESHVRRIVHPQDTIEVVDEDDEDVVDDDDDEDEEPKVQTIKIKKVHYKKHGSRVVVKRSIDSDIERVTRHLPEFSQLQVPRVQFSEQQLQEKIFDFEDVLTLILGKQISESAVQEVAQKLMLQTKQSWQLELQQERLHSDPDTVPASIVHNLAVTVVLRGPRPTYVATNLMFIHTLDRHTLWFKANTYVKSPIGVHLSMPHLFCADAVFASPKSPSEFYYDPTTEQDLEARLTAKIGWGAQCVAAGGVIVQGVLQKVPDVQKVQEEREDYFYHQCRLDRSEGKPASDACSKAILKESFLNQMVFDIQYENVPDTIKNMTLKLDYFLKAVLYENADINGLYVSNPEQAIRIKARWSEKIPQLSTVDVLVQKPQEEVLYRDLFLPKFRPISVLKTVKQVMLPIFGLHERDSCVVMEKAVKTFDNVTYELPQEIPDEYLVAMDGSPAERFAVIAREHSKIAKTKVVEVLIKGQAIKLMPPTAQNAVQIFIDGESHVITPKKSLIVDIARKPTRIFLKKSRSPSVASVLVINVPSEDVKVKYDGKNVKVITGKKYVGKLVGLCANNDKEMEDEFVGPDEAVYENSRDFVNSWVLSSTPKLQPRGRVYYPKLRQIPGTVEVKQQIKTKIQANGATSVHSQQVNVAVQNGKQVPACQQRLTQMITRDQLICFSTRPVLNCGTTCRAQQMNQIPMDWHCLPRNSPFTQQLVQEARNQVLTQLQNKRVDFQQSIQVPTACIAV